jgi:hypothetical protein
LEITLTVVTCSREQCVGLAAAIAALALSACSGSPLTGSPGSPNSDVAQPRTPSGTLVGERAIAPQAQSSCSYARVHKPILYVANYDNNNVLKYKGPSYSNPQTLFSVSGPTAIGKDANSDLFVASTNGSNNVVDVYPPPYKSIKKTIAPAGLIDPDGLVVDINDNLFIADFQGNQVFVLAPPYNGSPTIISGQSGPIGLALDNNCDLFIADLNSGRTINEVAPPYTGQPTVITNSAFCAPSGIAIDKSGNLWVANFSCSNVAEFKPPYTGKPIVTITNGVVNPHTVTFDSKRNIIVGNDSSTITIYAPPYRKAPIITISGNGLGLPLNAIDDATTM